MSRFFGDIAAIKYEGPDSRNPLAFRWYDADRVVLGRPMADLMIPERDRSRFREHIRTYVRTGNPEEFTGQMRASLLRAGGLWAAIAGFLKATVEFALDREDLGEPFRAFSIMSFASFALPCLKQASARFAWLISQSSAHTAPTEWPPFIRSCSAQ